MKKPDYVKVIKIAVGAGLAIVLAERMGLRYSASARTIAKPAPTAILMTFT